MITNDEFRAACKIVAETWTKEQYDMRYFCNNESIGYWSRDLLPEVGAECGTKYCIVGAIAASARRPVAEFLPEGLMMPPIFDPFAPWSFDEAMAVVRALGATREPLMQCASGGLKDRSALVGLPDWYAYYNHFLAGCAADPYIAEPSGDSLAVSPEEIEVVVA